MANKVICILLNLLLILTGFIPPKLSYAQNVYFYTIAVLDLAANGISETEAKSLSESLRGQITRVATSEEFKASSGFVYKVIERSQMTKILDEFEYQSTGCTDEKALDVNGNRISGSVTVKTGSGYSAELYC
ncbi:MAG: hypothetical protein JXB48_07860, partial [Candidatus Latescibacteria bacterium]|nr:hypothetical protein [Candidatus Latescibacterota bacterium]